MALPTPETFIPDLTVSAPGRINLIGEHTDYNMGYVLPAAVDKTIVFRFRRRPDVFRASFYSQMNQKGFTVSLDAISRSAQSWENYLLGVLAELSKRTDRVQGFDCEIESSLPAGSGLSSSAALECGLAFGLNELFGLGLTPWDLIALSRDAEHHFVGMQCGIMDQFASVMGREGHAMLLDCRSLEYSYHPLKLHPYKLVLLNSHVSHSLADSEYNLRRAQCEEGLSIIRQRFPVAGTLREVSPEMLLACQGSLSTVLYNRCAYVVSENERVLAAVDALEQGDLQRLGALFYSSHEGLRKQYEVSCPELDFLVDYTKKIPGVLGSRMMGGGFGGCTLNLVHEKDAEGFVGEITTAYQQQFGLQLTSFEGVPSSGVAVVGKKDA